MILKKHIPRSGMARPADTTYTFGAGKYMTSTTIMDPGMDAYILKFETLNNLSGTYTYYT